MLTVAIMYMGSVCINSKPHTGERGILLNSHHVTSELLHQSYITVFQTNNLATVRTSLTKMCTIKSLKSERLERDTTIT